MLNVVVEHVQKHLPLITLEGLDDESIISTKKEEAAACASTLSCSKNLVAVGEDVQRIDDLAHAQFVNSHQLLKLVLGVARDLEILAQLHHLCRSLQSQ